MKHDIKPGTLRGQQLTILAGLRPGSCRKYSNRLELDTGILSGCQQLMLARPHICGCEPPLAAGAGWSIAWIGVSGAELHGEMLCAFGSNRRQVLGGQNWGRNQVTDRGAIGGESLMGWKTRTSFAITTQNSGQRRGPPSTIFPCGAGSHRSREPATRASTFSPYPVGAGPRSSPAEIPPPQSLSGIWEVPRW